MEATYRFVVALLDGCAVAAAVACRCEVGVGEDEVGEGGEGGEEGGPHEPVLPHAQHHVQRPDPSPKSPKVGAAADLAMRRKLGGCGVGRREDGGCEAIT